MYQQFYGLSKSPFNVTSDPQFFFESSSHKKAFAALLYGIQERKGFVLITGEVGTGKTTLCRFALGKLPAQIKTSVILNPYFSEKELLQAIVEDFGLSLLGKKTRLDMINTLNSFLVDISLKDGNAVLIIDEAQNLRDRQLEQIRLLSNLETSQNKLIQIVLVGQPELVEKLNQYKFRQIRQRIFVKYHILPLPPEEVKNYVEFRLKLAGLTKLEIPRESFEVIYEFSRGIPRLINMLCDRALLFGFAKGKRSFDAEAFRDCIEELK